MADLPALLSRLRRRSFIVPVLIVAGLVAAYAASGFLLVPYLLKREIPRWFADRTASVAAVQDARFNPFLFKLEIAGFHLSERDGPPLLAFDRLFVDFEAVSLPRWAWTFAEITLDRPQLNLDMDPEGELNLAAFIARIGGTDRPGTQPQQAALPRLLLHHVALNGGRVAISDRSGASPVQASLDPVAFELKDLSTLPDRSGAYALTARLPAGGTLAWRGELSLQPLASDGEISIKGFKFSTLWGFFRDELLTEEPKGTLEASLRYQAAYANGALEMKADAVTLRAADLSVSSRGADAPLGTLAEASLLGGTFDLKQRRLAFSELALRRGGLALAVGADGALNWQSILAPATSTPRPMAAHEAGEAGGAPWQFAIESVRVEELAVNFADATRAAPIALQVGRADLDLSVKLETGVQPGLLVEGLSAKLSNLALTRQGEREPVIALDTATLEGGHFDLAGNSASARAVSLGGGATRIEREGDGTLNLAQAFIAKRSAPQPPQPPLALSVGQVVLAHHHVAYLDRMTEPPIGYDLEHAQVELNDVTVGVIPLRFRLAARVKQGGSLKASGMFYQERSRAEGRIEASRLALAPLIPLLERHVTLRLASGSASASGRFSWAGSGKDTGPGYTGSASIENLRLDEPGGERFLAWKLLAASGMNLASGASRLAIDELRLIEPGAKLVISKDRSVNVSGVLKPRAVSADAKPAPASPQAREIDVTIDRVSVERGELDFADLSLALPFSTRIQELSGAVTGLSSEPAARAGVKLEGRVEDYGLTRIDGTINPFAPKVHTDLAVAFRNVMMTPLTPYSVTFAGRRIASGRLSLDLQYKLENSELLGENKVLLEKFTLGERVRSESALNLPLDLAIALLTDADGRIDIAVPVRGNVDNPQFSYGHLVWQAIRTTITNIVTAPFRALGALFGGGEKVDDIGFDAGSDRLLPPEREKIGKLVETLKKRPQLKLMVQGRYHAVRDGTALRTSALRRTLVERQGAKLATDDDPGPIAYENAKVQQAIESLLRARGGADAVSAFVAAFEKKHGREARRVNPVLAVVGRGSTDRDLYVAMFDRLIELQPLPDTALRELAGRRAAAIAEQAVAGAGLAAARVGLVQPGAGDSESTAAKLSLDVLGVTP